MDSKNTKNETASNIYFFPCMHEICYFVSLERNLISLWYIYFSERTLVVGNTPYGNSIPAEPYMVPPSQFASSRTRGKILLRIFLLKALLARASYYKRVSLGPQDLDRSLGRHVPTYVETRQPIYTSQRSHLSEGGRML